MFAVTLLCCSSPGHAQTTPLEAPPLLALLTEMEQAWAAIDDYTVRVAKTERLADGKVTEQTVAVKFRRPDHFYMKVIDGPGKGGELIYPAAPGLTLAVAHAGGIKGGVARFLRKTVILRGMVPTEFRLDDPSIIKGQHQTVLDSGLGATIANIAANIRLAIREGDGRLSLRQDCETGDACQWRIDAELPASAGQTHVVQQGETLWTIASDYRRPMYVIFYNNPQLRSPAEIEVGQELFIPRYYAASGTVWVSAQSNLLTRLEIYDAGGNLYERYVYLEMQTNVGLGDRDFDTANPDYRF